MKPWRFVDYWPGPGRNPVRAWENAQIEDVRAALDAALDALRQTENWSEREDLYRDLEHDEKGLGEIVFETEQKGSDGKKFKRRFRAFVRLRVAHHDCILLTCCEHWPRHRSYDPPDAPQKAMKYLNAFEADQGFIDGHI